MTRLIEIMVFVTSQKISTDMLLYRNVTVNNKLFLLLYMSRVMRKPTFCICENKDADQLRGNREADQCLCFRYTDSTIPLPPKSEISRP